MKGSFRFHGLVLLALTVFLAHCARGSELQMLLQVHTEDAVRHETASAVERLARLTDASQVPGLAFLQDGDTKIRIKGEPAQLKRASALAKEALGNEFRERPAAEGRVFEMTPAAIEKIRRLAVEQTLITLRNRVEQLGLDDSVLAAQGGHRIVIRLPEVRDPERISRVLRSTALLEMRFVRFPAGGSGTDSREEILQHYGGQVPPELEILEGEMLNERGEVAFKKYYAVERARVATGNDFSNVRPSKGQFGEAVIEFRLKPAAAEVFSEATGNNVGAGLALVLDGRVLSAPKIRSRIGDSGEIQGGFTSAEAEDLVTLLRVGALPVRVTVLEENFLRPKE